jgi:hypothetical protein
MTGFFDCTGHLLLFGPIVIVFIFWHDLITAACISFYIGWCLILQKPVMPALFRLV